MKPPSSDNLRRSELAAFLKAKRASITPESVGLKSSSRRRTSGLRREEVATIAEISTDWYVWLEQGRDVRPSRAVLERLAGALRLTREETQFVLKLALPSARIDAPRIVSSIPEQVRRMLDALPNYPLYVRNRSWDILASNRCFKLVYAPWARTASNVLRLLYTNEGFKKHSGNLAENQRLNTALFRTSFSENPKEPRIKQLIDELTAISIDFRQHWQERSILDQTRRPAIIWHVSSQKLQFESQTLYPDTDPNLAITIHFPSNKPTEAFLNAMFASSER